MKTKTTNLTLNEIIQLETELSGFIHPKTNEVLVQGLLRQKVSMSIKFHIRTLVSSLKEHVKNVQELRNELIKTMGTGDEEKGFNIEPLIKEKGKPDEVNPVFIEFNKQVSELLNEEKEITHADFKLSDFKDITTEESYVVFDKLISE